MVNICVKDCITARVHIGHLSKKWDPRMSKYIFSKVGDRHIINVQKTIEGLEVACQNLKEIVASGKRVLFVATKKQVRDYITGIASEVNMPYVTQRWLGGTLTNFITIKKLLKRKDYDEKTINSESFKLLNKKERHAFVRRHNKRNTILSGISEMYRLPGALIVIDVKKEKIAVAEARRMNIPVIAIVDTNSDPSYIDNVIPANDDALDSAKLIIEEIKNSISEGRQVYLAEKEKNDISNKNDADNEENKDLKTNRKSTDSNEKRIKRKR